MAFLNVASLPKHIDEFRILLSSHNFELDVLALNETRLDSTFTDGEVNLIGYNIIRKDRNRRGGGVCIYIKNSINFKDRSDLIPDDVEAVCVEVSQTNSRPFLIITLYRPPNSPVEYLAKIQNLFDKIDHEDIEMHLMGDLNCNLLQLNPSHEIKILKDMLDMGQLSQLIQNPTRITLSTSTLIDLHITNDPNKVINTGVLHLGISDHSLIYAIRKKNPKVESSNKHNVIQIRSYKKFNASDFYNDIETCCWEDFNNCVSLDPNEMWLKWKNMFLSILDKHAPIKTLRIRRNKLPWITNDINRLIHERNCLKHKAVSCQNDIETTMYWNKYKILRNKVNIAIRKAKKFHYKKEFEKHKGDPKNTWKILNNLMGRHIFKQHSINEIKTNENLVVTKPDEITEHFNKYFTEIGPNLQLQICTQDQLNDKNFEEFIPNILSNFHFNETTVDVVHKLIMGISSSKATGIDALPIKLIKATAPIVVESLTALLNTIINTGIFPAEWKLARVTPIHKSGPRNLLDNYRPISVLPVLSKLLEKIMYHQLYGYLMANNLLSNNQFGFRKLHSTSTALVSATNEWLVNMDRGFLNLAVFIDLKKAFDTIDHQILLRKLQLYGVQGNSLNLLQSYMSNRSQVTLVNSELSQQKSITCGVPQGSILGPLLFLIYINDLPNCLNQAKSCLFADDTNLSFSGQCINDIEHQVNEDLNNLNIWLFANKLSLNVTKTEYMIIGTRQKLNSIIQSPDIHINNNKIKRVHKSKVVGVQIDDQLNWNEHIKYISKKINSGLGALKRIRPYVSIKMLKTVYNALIQSHLDYCCEIWDSLGKTLADKLQIFQNKAARIILRAEYDTSSETVLNAMNWDKLVERRAKRKALLMFKIIHNLAPVSLKKLVSSVEQTIHYNLRNSNVRLCVPLPKTEALKKSLSFSGPQLWNKLPNSLQNSSSLSKFKYKLKDVTLLS